MLPKNGASGICPPQGGCAVLVFEVDGDLDRAEHVAEILGQRAAAQCVVGPVLARLDCPDAHFERVARLGPCDMDRPCQDMRTELRGVAGVDVEMLGQYDHAVAGRRENVAAAGNRRERDRVSALDCEHRRKPGVEIAPVHGFRAGEELMMSRHC
jgi:hypothetical protein